METWFNPELTELMTLETVLVAAPAPLRSASAIVRASFVIAFSPLATSVYEVHPMWRYITSAIRVGLILSVVPKAEAIAPASRLTDPRPWAT